jgi:hypothetical protein
LVRKDATESKGVDNKRERDSHGIVVVAGGGGGGGVVLMLLQYKPNVDGWEHNS